MFQLCTKGFRSVTHDLKRFRENIFDFTDTNTEGQTWVRGGTNAAKAIAARPTQPLDRRQGSTAAGPGPDSGRKMGMRVKARLDGLW